TQAAPATRPWPKVIAVSRTLLDLLASYRPTGETEASDVAALRALAQATGDPWSRAAPLHATASAVVVHPGSGRVLLRWQPLPQAHAATSQANFAETLSRVERLLSG